MYYTLKNAVQWAQRRMYQLLPFNIFAGKLQNQDIDVTMNL